MVNGIRTGEPRGFNKGRSSKFHEGSRVRQTPEEDRRTYRLKRCGNNNKDEDNITKTLNDKNSKKKLATVVEGNQKALFSIATTPMCREGRYSFPRIAPLYP